MPLLEVRGLSASYRGAGRAVRPFRDLELDAEAGEVVLVTGPSGTGKTTLLSCLAGILTPTEGSVSLAGVDITTLGRGALDAYRRRQVGLVFQSANLVDSLSAAENVAVPLWVAGVRRAAARQQALQRLSDVGMSDRTEHRPGALSGGQRQRVAIARALAHDPALVLADEPTSHLDAASAEDVVLILRELAMAGRTVVVATHDRRLRAIADREVSLVPVVDRPPEPATRGLVAGEVLFSQGDASALVYRVEHGEVELLRDAAEVGKEEVVRVCGAGEYFGEIGPLLGFPRSATAKARTDAEVTGLSIAELRDQVSDVALPLVPRRPGSGEPGC